MASTLRLAFLLLLVASPSIAQKVIPNYVRDYAPIVYLDKNELYLPSDLSTHVRNTFPALNLSRVEKEGLEPDLSNLDQYNMADERCIWPSNSRRRKLFGDCSVYLTSTSNISSAPTPEWLLGVLPEKESGETRGANSSAIVVHDRGDGRVDAFYFYFYSFNEGNEVFGDHTGNHVGDWEHNMIRFQDGKPQAIWYSQHEGGQAFTFDAVSKKENRPIVYSSLGGHANYAVPGTHSREVSGVGINDTTSEGPMWDPTLNAYFYTFTPLRDKEGVRGLGGNGTFSPANPSTPVGFLYFFGRWGDKRYSDDDPRQRNLAGLNITYKFESGPEGPAAKGLDRDDVCPGPGRCGTLTELPPQSGSELPVTMTRTRTGRGVLEATTTGTPSASASEATQTGSGAVISAWASWSADHPVAFTLVLCAAIL